MLLRATITTETVKRTLACMKADQFVNACLQVIFARARNPPSFKVDQKCINLKMQNERDKGRKKYKNSWQEEETHTHTHTLTLTYTLVASLFHLFV